MKHVDIQPKYVFAMLGFVILILNLIMLLSNPEMMSARADYYAKRKSIE